MSTRLPADEHFPPGYIHDLPGRFVLVREFHDCSTQDVDVLIICGVNPEAHRNQVVEAEGLGDIRPNQATLTPCVSHGADEGYLGD